MLHSVLEEGGWTCLCNEAQLPLLSGITNIEDLISSLCALPVTLKDNHRSTVKRGNLSNLGIDLELIAKRPHDKNRRRWSRLSSLFVPGEAAITIENLNKLQAANIPSVKPLFALEKRSKGMIVDSWMCYEYRAGEPCGEAGLSDIIALLHQMHAAGFRHGDPTWNNFLNDSEGTLFTIDTKARPCAGAFHATNDFVLLKRANKLYDLEINTLGNLDRASFGYWLAMTYMAVKGARSGLRDKIKKNRPKNT